jgi:hypothetical protein
MGTPPYYFGRREDNDFHRKPVGKLAKQFEVMCMCGSHNIKIVAESDEEGLKLYFFCVGCRGREEISIR